MQQFILLLFFVNVAGKEDDQFAKTIANAIATIDNYDKNTKYKVGAEIQSYIIDKEKVIENTISTIRPVVEGENIRYFVIEYENTIKVEKCELESLNAYAKFAIVIKDETSYIVSEDNVKLYSTYHGNSKLTPKEIGTVRTSLSDRRKIQESEIELTFEDVSITSSTTFPSVAQYPYDNGCWVACIAAFCNYYLGGNRTVSTVLSTCFPGEVFTNDSLIEHDTEYIKTLIRSNYLIELLDTPTVISMPTVKTDINTNNKKYMIGWHFTTTQGGYGHITCMYSCVEGLPGRYTIGIMDPHGTGSSMSTVAEKYSLTSTNGSMPTNNAVFGVILGTYESGLVYNRRLLPYEV